MSEEQRTHRKTPRRIMTWDIIFGVAVVSFLAIVVVALAREWRALQSARDQPFPQSRMGTAEARKLLRQEFRKVVRRHQPEIRAFGMTLGQMVGVAVETWDGGGPGVAVWQVSGTVVGSEIVEEAVAEAWVLLFTYPQSQSASTPGTTLPGRRGRAGP